MKEPEVVVECERCGRKLKNPMFQKIGLGKVCLQKVHAGSHVDKNGNVQLGLDEFEGGSQHDKNSETV